MVESDEVECIIGLGPNLFYNSPMEACLLITNTNKTDGKKEKILFINAVNEVRQDKSIAYLEEHHIKNIFNAYKNNQDVDSLSRWVDLDEVKTNKYKLALNLYVMSNNKENNQLSFSKAYGEWKESSEDLRQSMTELFTLIETRG